MNIFPQNHNTSFQGIYKGTVKINELKNGLKLPKDVSVVELNPRDKHDLKVLDKLSETWEKADFSDRIFCNAVAATAKNADPSQYKFFIITKQNKDFDKIKAKDVLAQAQIDFDEYHIKNKVWIDFLEVKPETKYGTEKRKYSDIGKRFLDYFKSAYKGKTLSLVPTDSAKPFYEKQNFIRPFNSHTMEYQA